MAENHAGDLVIRRNMTAFRILPKCATPTASESYLPLINYRQAIPFMVPCRAVTQGTHHALKLRKSVTVRFKPANPRTIRQIVYRTDFKGLRLGFGLSVLGRLNQPQRWQKQ